MAIIPAGAKIQREIAVRWVIFATFEIVFQADISCFAEAFKPGLGTPKPFGALHLPNDFVDLLSSLFVHELLFSMHDNVYVVFRLTSWTSRRFEELHATTVPLQDTE